MAAPANDDIANAQVLTSGTQVLGSNVDATVQPGELRGNLGTPGPSVWYVWQCPVPAPGTVQFDTIGSTFDTHLAIYRKNAASPSTPSDLEFLERDDDSGGAGTSLLMFTPVAGVRYWIQVAGYNSGDTGSITLNYPTPGTAPLAPNDLIANAAVLQNGTVSTPTLVDNSGATAESGELTGTGDSTSTVSAAGHQTLWWRWTAPSNGSVTISTTGSVQANLTSPLDTYLTVFKAKSGVSDPVAAVTDLDIVASDDDETGTVFTSSVTFSAVAGVVYYLQVRCLNPGTFGYYKLNYPAPGSAHLFSSQTPTAAHIDDATPLTLATTVTFATNGKVTGARFFAPTFPNGTYELVLWRCDTDDSSSSGTGTLLASAPVSVAVAGQWNHVAFEAPQTVTAGRPYRVGLRTGAGRYVATSAFFASSGLANGNITGIQTGATVPGYGVFSNGAFSSGISNYPNQTFGGGNYFVDVAFTADPVSGATANAGVAEVAAAGQNPRAQIVASSGQAAVTAAGQNATASTTTATTANAGVADVGVAGNASTVLLGPSTGVAGVSAAGFNPATLAASTASAGAAAASADALNATTQTAVTVTAGAADVTADAHNPAITYAVQADAGMAGVGVDAHNASTGFTVQADAGTAAVGADGYSPTVTAASTAAAGVALVDASAANPTVSTSSSVTVNPGVAEVAADGHAATALPVVAVGAGTAVVGADAQSPAAIVAALPVAGVAEAGADALPPSVAVVVAVGSAGVGADGHNPAVNTEASTVASAGAAQVGADAGNPAVLTAVITQADVARAAAAAHGATAVTEATSEASALTALALAEAFGALAVTTAVAYPGVAEVGVAALSVPKQRRPGVLTVGATRSTLTAGTTAGPTYSAGGDG